MNRDKTRNESAYYIKKDNYDNIDEWSLRRNSKLEVMECVI